MAGLSSSIAEASAAPDESNPTLFTFAIKAPVDDKYIESPTSAVASPSISINVPAVTPVETVSAAVACEADIVFINVSGSSAVRISNSVSPKH